MASCLNHILPPLKLFFTNIPEEDILLKPTCLDSVNFHYERNGFSETLFYGLRAEGKGPDNLIRESPASTEHLEPFISFTAVVYLLFGNHLIYCNPFWFKGP